MNKQYEILQKYGDYTVLKKNSIIPFVVAYNLHEDMTWDNGHYFNDLFTAAEYAYAMGRDKTPYYRLQDIAMDLARGLELDDMQSAHEYFRDTVGLTNREAELLGIDDYEEELDLDEEPDLTE